MTRPQGTISYPGILRPKGGIYTQTLGVHPDTVVIRCIPQDTAIASSGNVTLAFNGTSLVILNCVFDSAQIVYDASDGFLLSLAFHDRRVIWQRADTISGFYNIRRAGTQVASKKKSLRELAEILLLHLGETSPNVSALSNSIYPEVRWEDESPVAMLDELLSEWGFSLALGFSTEPVTVVQIGTGAAISTTYAMMSSSSIDPKLRPEYARVRFGPTLMQARFKLEAVALETDDTWVPIASASYEPSVTWAKEHPVRLPNTQQTATADAYARAITTVYRAYRIKHFADGTLDIPDESGTLTNIFQCLPLQNRLLDSEAIRTDGSSIPFRIYGKRQVPNSSMGEPVKVEVSSIDDEIVGERVVFDGENGIIIFENPQWYEDTDDFYPAELYLECTFTITDTDNNYPYRYLKDTLIDAAGTGYHAVKYHELEKRVVVAYGASQAVTGDTDNVTDLDAIAALIAGAVSPQYATEGAQVVLFNQPILSLRCDGAIHQVQHVISDGTSHAGSFSTASRNYEFDRMIHTRDERTAVRNSLIGVFSARTKQALVKRKEAADD